LAEKRYKISDSLILDVIDNFKGKKICVIGDIIADVFIFGKPYRLSREAPVVVIRYENEMVCPGSAGNTINNLLTLGAYVYPIGIIGTDSTGDRLIEYFSRFNDIDLDGIIRQKGETITKTRILAGDTHTSKQQVIRIDKDPGLKVSEKLKKRLFKKMDDISKNMDAFILSDYGHGTVDKEIIEYLKTNAKDKIIVGDSRYNLKNYNGITMITPNEAEAYALCSAEEDTDIESVGKTIMGFMELEALLITRGNKGMSLFLKNGDIYHIPISGTDDVTDVTGAGDTVCAAATLSLASGADYYISSLIANFAAGVVVMKRGTATVSPDELKRNIKEWFKANG